MSNKFKKLTKTVISNVKFDEYDDEKIVVEKAEDVLPQDLIEKVNKIPFFPNHCTYNAYRVSYFIPEVDFVECLFGDNSDFTLNPHCINRYKGHYFDVSFDDNVPYFVKRVFKSKEIQKVFKFKPNNLYGSYNGIFETKGTITSFLPNKDGKILSSKGCMVSSNYPEGYKKVEFVRFGQKVHSVAKYIDKDEYYQMVA